MKLTHYNMPFQNVYWGNDQVCNNDDGLGSSVASCKRDGEHDAFQSYSVVEDIEAALWDTVKCNTHSLAARTSFPQTQ